MFSNAQEQRHHADLLCAPVHQAGHGGWQIRLCQLQKSADHGMTGLARGDARGTASIGWRQSGSREPWPNSTMAEGPLPKGKFIA